MAAYCRPKLSQTAAAMVRATSQAPGCSATPRTINDGTFFSPEEDWFMWGDLPAVRHALGCNLSFADGHADHWRWRWLKKESGPPVNSDDTQDLQRLWLASPGP